MNPRVRMILFVAAGAALGIAIGVEIADESYGLSALISLAATWLALRKTNPGAPDAWLVAVIMVGYIVGNRGFAQLQPAAQIPLLPAEAVLLFVVPSLLFRIAVKRSRGFQADALNYSILAWMILGAIRLPRDMQTFGVIALRDFATIYYACFFFIAQDLAGQEDSRRIMKGALTWSYLLLPPVVVSIVISPDFLLDHLTIRGIPLIYHKSDLIAMSLAGGFFWLWTRWEKTQHARWIAAAATSLILIGAMDSPRAGMFAVAVTTALWIFTGRWRIAAAEGFVVTGALALSIAYVVLTGRDLKTSAPYSVYEHAISIFDPAGQGTYINGESGDPGGNNRFRLIWWRDVAEDTLAQNPVMGIGFGGDLASRFLADYDLLSDENFAARSPHSIVFTVIGRMGLLGLTAWIAISASLLTLAWKTLKSGDPDQRGLVSVALSVFLSACFGVVLEGPMGAVAFWTVLGIANARGRTIQPSGPASPQTHCTSTASGEWPVANGASLGSESVAR